MGAQHRHPDAGDADRDRLVLEDLPRFVDDLGLFFVIAGLGIDPGVVIEDVEGVRMRQHGGDIALAGEARTG